ncbi:MAG: helix-turn-helix domain-containing protein [Aquidulcibacter sp.]|uniref:helix-turn-helix domain-containing protein n=1 Tax=Aquidulcibacter sp. TaxID=2052990 RepID=UPI0022C0B7FA|nr:helix-turn-helix domain-containing protein [Aquidulcibacter sp.]
MSPAEAARTLDAAKALHSGRAHLRLVGSIDNPDADGPGARLQAARRDQELSIHQVAAALRLKAEQVAAIESMQFQKLPGLGYALGYVRAYGELLGLVDCDGLVSEFRDAWEPVQRRRESEIATKPSKFVAPAGAVVALALLAWLIVWASLHAVKPQPVDVVAPPDEKIKAWAEAQQNGPVQATADVQPLSTLKALQDVRVTLRGEDGALVTDRILRKDESISTDGLGRWFVSSPFGGVLEASGYGQTALVGEAGKKVVNWRVPDFEAIAIAKSKAEAEAAAALAAAEAAKLAAQQAKDQPAVTQTTAPYGVNPGNTTIRPADPANASPGTATPASAKVVGPVTQ